MDIITILDTVGTTFIQFIAIVTLVFEAGLILGAFFGDWQ